MACRCLTRPPPSTKRCRTSTSRSYSLGDLVFFYNPISHVGLYIGGGQMIDASHAGPGGEVNIRSIYWENFTVGGRVG